MWQRELGFQTGPFVVHLRLEHRATYELLLRLYPEGGVIGDPKPLSYFHLSLRRPWTLRRWWRPQVLFFLEDHCPFEPYPLDHAFPLLEWGLNWCIATHAHRYLLLHAAVLETNGWALILPATPGAGKSTLAAALACRGWRLLSDEFGVVDPTSGWVHPLPRAIPLKNESIEVIRAFAPDALIGPCFEKTRKGTVAHLSPPGDALRRQGEVAWPKWLVFPHYIPGHATELVPLSSSVAFTRLAQNAFNYRLLGETGFRTLAALIRRTRAYTFRYSKLHEAIDCFSALAED